MSLFDIYLEEHKNLILDHLLRKDTTPEDRDRQWQSILKDQHDIILFVILAKSEKASRKLNKSIQLLTILLVLLAAVQLLHTVFPNILITGSAFLFALIIVGVFLLWFREEN